VLGAAERLVADDEARVRRPGVTAKAALLAAAADAFSELGYEGASIDSIASRAGVTGGALYRHFASKAQMFEGLIEFIETTLFTLINRIASETPDGAAQAQQIVAVVLGFAERNPGMTRVLTGDALVNEDERLQARMNQFFDRFEATLKQALRAASDSDAGAHAAALLRYALGALHQFAKSGFARRPTEGYAAQLAILAA